MSSRNLKKVEALKTEVGGVDGDYLLFGMKQNLSRVLKQGRHQTLSDITNFVNEGKDRTFCQKTIERKICSLGYKWRAAARKIVVREVNKKKRVKWCKERRTVEGQRKKWIFSNESQIVIGENNRIYTWRKDDEQDQLHLVCPAPRRRLCLMVWGCVCVTMVWGL